MKTDTNIESIEHLDFDIQHPCEHETHGKYQDHPDTEMATWMVHVKCFVCGGEKIYALCEPGRRHLTASKRVVCRFCRQNFTSWLPHVQSITRIKK